MADANRVWLRFVGKKSDGTEIKFRIQDLPVDKMDDVYELYMNHFAKDEAILKASGAYKTEKVEDLFVKMFNKNYNHVMICCVDDDPNVFGRIAAAGTMTLANGEEEKPDELTTPEELKKLIEMITYMFTMYDIRKAKNIDAFYDGRGIIVHPDFRKMGIANQIVKARRLICKEHKVPLTAAWMSTWGTQKAADNDGWETVLEVPYKEFEHKFHVTFENVPPTCKLMVAPAAQ